MKRIRVLPGLVILLLMSGPALGLTIDEWDSGTDFSLIVADTTHMPALPQTAQLVEAVAGVLGGYRDVYIRHLSGDTNNTASATFDDADSYMSYSNDSGIDSELTLTYDNNGSGFGGLGIDLTEGGISPSILMKFLGSDIGADVTVTITDINGLTLTHQQGTPGTTTGEILAFDFDDFTGTGDETAADSVVFFIEGEPRGDHDIDFIKTGIIPEPVTMAGLLLGIGALGGYIRRRRA